MCVRQWGWIIEVIRIMSSERLQKLLSQAGLGSRREMERWIESGLIHVNGVVAKLGDSATSDDKISVKGRIIDNPLKIASRTRILIYYKPVGEISSRSDPKHSRTVFDHLPHLKQGRWIQVGRLDINTSGLLLFTNNGELANRLMHPKYELEREYAVRVYGQVSPDIIKALLKGVPFDDGIAKFKSIDFRGGEGTNSWYHVVLTEGRNREVRRLWQSQGVEVSRLVRVRYGEFQLPRSLDRGSFVELSSKDVEGYIARL
jgi:23S rRNA pseudouridine2605 synthase